MLMLFSLVYCIRLNKVFTDETDQLLYKVSLSI